MSKVSAIKCSNYLNVKESLKKALDLIGGLDKFIKPDEKVLLKPNFCNPAKRSQATVTDPFFIKAMIELVQEITPNVYVGDITAVNRRGTLYEVLSSAGIDDILKQTGARLANLEKVGFIAKDIPGYKILDKTDFTKAYFGFDTIINMPKLKSHGLTHLTGAVKNTFGLVMMGERQYLHTEFNASDFCHGIVDIYSFVKPKIKIHVMDAIIGQEGDEGPSYGDPVNIGYILASEDGVAMDAVASKITGHNPMEILTTKHAHDRKIGNADNIDIAGDAIETVEFKKHTNYLNRNKEKASAFPFINENCTKCGACYKACPVNAISKTDKGYCIDTSKCIRCYCCIENCIYKAISLSDKINEPVSEKEPKEDKEKPKQEKEAKFKDIPGKIANLRLGLGCNQDCLFCTIADDKEKTLTFEQAKEKIDMLRKDGVTVLTITGGEPTIIKYLADIIKYAKEKGIKKIELQTNAVMLADEDYLNRLIEAGLDFILIAFHSHKENIYNKLTNSEYYNEALQGLKNCIKYNLQIEISHVINTENHEQLIGFIKFINSISKDIGFYFSFLRPNGNTQRHKELVPKLMDIEVNLYHTFMHCRENGIHFSVEGVPLCYMRGFEKYSAETQRISKPPQEYVGAGEGHEDLHEFIHSNLKKKSEVCSICFLNKFCAGVWREYAEIHGIDELYPIFTKVEGLNG